MFSLRISRAPKGRHESKHLTNSIEPNITSLIAGNHICKENKKREDVAVPNKFQFYSSVPPFKPVQGCHGERGSALPDLQLDLYIP